MFRIPKQNMPSTATASSQTHNSNARKVRDVNSTHASKKCSYTSYDCTHPTLDGYSYCMRHILEDPMAPYKQCNFIYNYNSRKCQNAAPKLDRRDNSYCPEHARKAQIARINTSLKRTLPESPETLLLSLGHYVNTGDVDDCSKQKRAKVLDPFSDIDAQKVNMKATEILDYASSSESDVEPTLLCDTITRNLDDSDDECLSSQQEDPLRYAGIYTAEEIVSLTRDKILRLQSLYIDQFRRLQYLLKEKKRKYLHALKKEKETLCSIHDQAKSSAKEKKIYQKLKALNSYHRRSGVEAILYKKSLDRRALTTDGPTQKAPNIPKCIFTEGGVKCGERTLPSSKYCKKHVLKDTHQVLFKACGIIEGDTECHEPVPVIFDTNCVFHKNLPKPLKLEPMKFNEQKPDIKEEVKEEHDLTGENQDIDPDDDIAGIMREMKDVVNKKSCMNDSVMSEASTDTAFSISAQLSDRDELVSA